MLVNTPALVKDLLALLPDVLPSVTIDELKELPRSSACYLWMKEDEVLYVGLTHNMHYRWNNQQPHKLPQLLKKGAERLSWITLKNSRSFEDMEENAKILEATLIQLYAPPLNIEYNPKFRFRWQDKKKPSRKLM
jgi:excinuclease UvrABC nuclease subunit